ncbi:hypothetical protein [Paenibacillus odorifer]|uniref:hypothetical protein n=1 Tax=Paenibacillus odorifer TaxID=189426 RepID=UPI00096DC4E9|nr:hypothetical protein [Paenibacillus odorifer]OMD75301.1 hypothetical protein BSK50_19060 [Paenibacillus odorifer]
MLKDNIFYVTANLEESGWNFSITTIDTNKGDGHLIRNNDSSSFETYLPRLLEHIEKLQPKQVIFERNGPLNPMAARFQEYLISRSKKVRVDDKGILYYKR